MSQLCTLKTTPSEAVLFLRVDHFGPPPFCYRKEVDADSLWEQPNVVTQCSQKYNPAIGNFSLTALRPTYLRG